MIRMQTTTTTLLCNIPTRLNRLPVSDFRQRLADTHDILVSLEYLFRTANLNGNDHSPCLMSISAVVAYKRPYNNSFYLFPDK